jgi:hypothetical protein
MPYDRAGGPTALSAIRPNAAETHGGPIFLGRRTHFLQDPPKPNGSSHLPAG